MENNSLNKVRDFEIKAGEEIDALRPAFHFSTRAGWSNDPNGFSFYKGLYHLFYQYHPYKAFWDVMYWGHSTSADMVKWDYLPATLAPEFDYEKDGCFSGSAVELDDKSQLLMYTGVYKEDENIAKGQWVQQQCIAIGDGLNYKKHSANPVIKTEDLPKGGNKYDFRDPKIWRDKMGRFFCVLANYNDEVGGHILLYSSEDAIKWNFEKVLYHKNNEIGLMWECPDFFEIDDKHLLIFSPQNVMANGLKFTGGNISLCVVGEYDKENFDFKEQSIQTIDYGIDFYAPQTTLTPDGRRVMIAWMQNPTTVDLQKPERKFMGQMTFPRELYVKNNKLIQKPIRELEKYLKNKVGYKDVEICGVKKFNDINGESINLNVSIRPKNNYNSFTIKFKQKGEYYCSLTFKPCENILEFSRKYCGTRSAVIHETKCFVDGKAKEIELQILIDRYSVEIFINGGQQVMTSLVLSEFEDMRDITFECDGAVIANIEKFDIIT